MQDCAGFQEVLNVHAMIAVSEEGPYSGLDAMGAGYVDAGGRDSRCCWQQHLGVKVCLGWYDCVCEYVKTCVFWSCYVVICRVGGCWGGVSNPTACELQCYSATRTRYKASVSANESTMGRYGAS